MSLCNRSQDVVQTLGQQHEPYTSQSIHQHSFDFEHPVATNCFVARWKLYQLKGSILNQALNLIQSSLVPFGLLLCRALHRLMVSVRLTIMRHCFECTCSGGVCILHSLVQCQVIELLSTEQVLESSL